MTFRASAAFTERWDHFDLAIEDGIATVTFARPAVLNALTFQVYADLRDLLAELPHRDDTRVLVITGTGRGFCSGGDVDSIIGELLDKKSSKQLLDFTRMTGSVVQGMRELPMPIIAAVNGIAAGAGSVIALAADFRLLAASSSFAFLFTRVGLAGADMGSAYLLPRLVGLGRATELLMLGDSIGADDAADLGLGRVVADAELPTETRVLAGRLAEGPTFAYAATKLLLSRELDMDLAGSIELEAMTQALLMTGHDHREFYEAFKQGRNPQWRGT